VLSKIFILPIVSIEFNLLMPFTSASKEAEVGGRFLPVSLGETGMQGISGNCEGPFEEDNRPDATRSSFLPQ